MELKGKDKYLPEFSNLVESVELGLAASAANAHKPQSKKFRLSIRISAINPHKKFHPKAVQPIPKVVPLHQTMKVIQMPHHIASYFVQSDALS